MMLALATLVVLGLLNRQPVNGTAPLVVGAVFGAMAWWAVPGEGAGQVTAGHPCTPCCVRALRGQVLVSGCVVSRHIPSPLTGEAQVRVVTSETGS